MNYNEAITAAITASMKEAHDKAIVHSVFVCTGADRKGNKKFQFLNPKNIVFGKTTLGNYINEMKAEHIQLHKQVDELTEQVNKLQKAILALADMQDENNVL